MSMKKRNIILGIDGVPFELMDNLSNRGFMPNFNELKKEFTFKLMKSSIPHISSVSWSSIITGKNPGEHGIYGFTDIIKNTYSISFPNFNALKCDTFWQKEVEKKHVIINVPSTYPAKELNGIHIAGFVAINLEDAIYPKSYFQYLKDIGYEIDIDSSLAHQQSKDAFFNELFRVLEIRKKTYQKLWNVCDWNNFMVVITGSDRIGHFLWQTYEDNTNQYHGKFLDFFKEIDKIIGDLNSKLKPDDTFIILSDHGMERNKQNVNLNSYLVKEGFIKLSDNLKRYNRIQEGSKAFALDPGRIYLNKKSLYPNGTVEKYDEKHVIEDLKKLFSDLKFKNERVIKKIYEKEEIYSGKMIDNAPDLVLIENEGFQLKGVIGKKKIFEDETVFQGKHDDNAFLFINKDIDLINPTVIDMVGLME